MNAWEERESNSVGVVILHTEIVPIAWAFGLRNLQLPGRPELRRFDPFLPIAGRPFDDARNTGTQHFLNLGCQWVFHLDSDCVVPSDAILRLMQHNLPIVSGLYNRRSPPHGVPVMMKDGQWVTNFRMGSMVEVDLVGAGCLLLRRDFLEKLPWNDEALGRRWFSWKVDRAGRVPPGEALSEDFSMNLLARRNGYKIWCDTSVQCKHVGLAQAEFNSYLPAEVRVRT